MFGFAASAQAQDKALIEKGMKVYETQKCSLCHSVAGKGNAKGSLDGVGTKLTEADIRLWMTDPKTMSTKTKATRTPPMKAYSSLAKEDMDAVVAYMVSLKKK
jgi:mono/diheme cytochrome c family protein